MPALSYTDGPLRQGANRSSEPDAAPAQIGRVASLAEGLLRHAQARYPHWSEPDLDDLVQDAVVEAIDTVLRDRRSPPLEPWLRAIVGRRAQDRRERDELAPRMSSIDLDGVEARVCSSESEGLEIFRWIVATLSGPERRVVSLKLVEDCTFPEIAARLRISANTAKTRYYRSLAVLRTRIGATEEPSETIGARASELGFLVPD